MVAAEELDMDMSQMIYGTRRAGTPGRRSTVNDDLRRGRSTGGIGGSNSMSSTGPRIRAAAVAARHELLKLASTKLGVPVASLTVEQGRRLGRRQVRHLRRARRRQALQRHADDDRRCSTASHRSKPVEPVQAGRRRRRRASTSRPRSRATTPTSHNVRAPGHAARPLVRPRGQGPWLTDGFAKPLSVDASSITHLPNVKVVQAGDFLGVVAPGEYERDPGRGRS